MSLSDRLLIPFVLLWLGQTAWFFLIREPVWGGLWALIFVMVIVAELLSKRFFGKTITQRWKAWAKQHRLLAVLMLVGLLVNWILLLAHLAL
jgi:hypothetical protein